jgi:hypothetical protein
MLIFTSTRPIVLKHLENKLKTCEKGLYHRQLHWRMISRYCIIRTITTHTNTPRHHDTNNFNTPGSLQRIDVGTTHTFCCLYSWSFHSPSCDQTLLPCFLTTFHRWRVVSPSFSTLRVSGFGSFSRWSFCFLSGSFWSNLMYYVEFQSFLHSRGFSALRISVLVDWWFVYEKR